MPDVAKLSVVVDADTSAAERELNTFGSKLGGVGNSIATAFGGAAIAGIAGVAAGLGAAVMSAADFEKTMSGVKAVSGASAEEMSQLSGLALQLGKDTSFSASEAASGLEELVKGGLSIPDIMNGAAKATLDLAAAGGVSLPDAATIAANALAEFNLKGSDMAHVADLIAGAANASALDVSDFKFSLSAAGAVAATVGFSFDDLAQGIAVMGKAGITGSDAGTSLKTMMMNLVPATNKAADTMRDLGIITGDTGPGLAKLREGLQATAAGQAELARLTKTGLVGSEEELFKALDKVNPSLLQGASSATDYGVKVGLLGNQFFDANGKVKSMAQVADVLKTALAGMSQEQELATLRTLFGSDAIRAAAVLAKEGAAGFDEMAASMGKVTAESVGAERLNNLAGAWEQLKGSLETAAITVGTALLPALTSLTQWATGAVNDMIPNLDALAKGFGDMVTFFLGSGEHVPEAFQRIKAAMEDAFGPDVAQAISQTLLDIRETVDLVTEAIALLFENHGDQIQTGWQRTWRGVITDTTARLQELLSVIRIFALASEGDWQGVWSEMTRVSDTEGQRQTSAAQRNADAATAVIDRFTGGMATSFRTFFDGLGPAVVAGWQAVVTATEQAGSSTRRTVDEAWAAISSTISTAAHGVIDPVTTAWNQVKSVTDTVFAAVKNVLTAVWDAIYDSVIKPKLDVISTFISTTWETVRAAVETKVNAARDLIGLAWEAVSTKTHEVLDAVLMYVSDTIFEPMRAVIETKINAARDLFGQAVQAVSDKAHEVLDPFLTYWRDTIWEPMRAIVDTAMYGQKGVYTQFDSAISSLDGIVNGTLQGLKTVWETTWAAIQHAAESPKAAMDEIIRLVDKLKTIMPEWLIPHSPTPFEMGLRGISDAARSLDHAFGDMTSVDGWLQSALKYTKMPESWLGPLEWIVQHESSGDPHAKNPNSTASGLFQIIDTTWDAYRDKSLPNDIFNPIINAIGGIRYIAGRYGNPDNAVDFWKANGHYAAGGWAGLHGPELAWLGEKGPEYIVPNRDIRAGAGGSSVTIDLRGAQVYDGSKFEDMMVRALDKAERGGRIVKVTR